MSDDLKGVIAILAVLIAIGLMFLVPAIELWLWGVVMIPVFNAPALTYWQMFALSWLLGLFFRRSSVIDKKNLGVD